MERSIANLVNDAIASLGTKNEDGDKTCRVIIKTPKAVLTIELPEVYIEKTFQ